MPRVSTHSVVALPSFNISQLSRQGKLDGVKQRYYHQVVIKIKLSCETTSLILVEGPVRALQRALHKCWQPAGPSAR